jgi:hypothetical protein
MLISRARLIKRMLGLGRLRGAEQPSGVGVAAVSTEADHGGDWPTVEPGGLSEVAFRNPGEDLCENFDDLDGNCRERGSIYLPLVSTLFSKR